AKEAQGAITEEMGRVFDRPINKTVKGTFVKPATKQSLVATLWIKDDFYTGTAVDQYLRAEIEGGPRRHKRFEKALIAAGIMPSDLYAVPGG
ncbi:hypothetical protein NQU36_26175, partial [Escherichia coli]|uniref:hypothetical protein n=1 Tax=Escherichia coli TaxID=562 RepID=UPI003F7A8D6F|nr:hypothetical protein [Escherichia coli]